MYLKIRASSWSLAKVILRCTVSETSKQRTCKFHKGQKISWLTKQLLASRVLCCKDRVWCLTTWRKHTPNCLATLHVFKKDTDRCATVPTGRELPSAFSITTCDSHICWQSPSQSSPTDSFTSDPKRTLLSGRFIDLIILHELTTDRLKNNFDGCQRIMLFAVIQQKSQISLTTTLVLISYMFRSQ